ncbi:hypothetical protein [Pedobacter sp. CFBP9032]|uniref:hypothetical protein n=1 Tax=Pedobacter sp. CFBP9032 TaxID=3096539 RepID=UPI002A6A92F4|nr:hypothetical protein [Pedobacter sp. CFBP9032]MDY0903326.1 hypothetical protein [Pedobacter sp. CFBP9032]
MNAQKTKHNFHKESKAKSIIYTALIGIRKEVKMAFILATLSILLIELYLINIPSPFHFIYSIGTIYLKACYAIFGSTIFYFINVQIPKEHKKIKSSLFIHNRIIIMYAKMSIITEGLKLDRSPFVKLSQESFKEALKVIDPATVVQSQNFGSFLNWSNLLTFLHVESKTTLKEILLLQDVVDTKILERLIQIENSFNLMIFHPFGKTIHPEIWETLDRDLYDIWYSNVKLYAQLEKSYGETLRQKTEIQKKERNSSLNKV